MIYAVILTIAAFAYSYFSIRRMQKQMEKANKPNNQLDGSICDEGTSFTDIAGSPHVYGNIIWMGNVTTEPIKVKQKKK